MPRLLHCGLLGLLTCCLAACGGKPRAPIEDLNRPAVRSDPAVYSSSPRRAPGGQYRVRQGETLYAIAWRHGLDFRALAAANGIPAPYTIYPGQLLHLKETPLPVAARPPGPPPASTASPVKSASAPTATPAPGTTSASAPAPAPISKPVVTPSTPVAAPDRALSRWRWPSRGRVVRRFSSSVHKGIDIDGKRGEAVVAVADGVVVYAGNGIVGFGELLIVKHNDSYLSAYGHNQRLLVAEGASVRAGQNIAEKGSSGTDTVKLHFEIRRDGRPVDPLSLLPKR
ncbi:MAG: peptidoglycan DD-metalloendopeptidase family protein [Parahaliea sp.]